MIQPGALLLEIITRGLAASLALCTLWRVSSREPNSLGIADLRGVVLLADAAQGTLAATVAFNVSRPSLTFRAAKPGSCPGNGGSCGCEGVPSPVACEPGPGSSCAARSVAAAAPGVPGPVPFVSGWEQAMEPELIERLSRRVSTRLDRRALAGLAGLGLLGTLGLPVDSQARKKKKKKKKKKEQCVGLRQRCISTCEPDEPCASCCIGYCGTVYPFAHVCCVPRFLPCPAGCLPDTPCDACCSGLCRSDGVCQA